MKEHPLDLVTAKVILDRVGIPRSTLYRLADAGKIPSHLAPRQPWHRRRTLLFSVEEVEQALQTLNHNDTQDR